MSSSCGSPGVSSVSSLLICYAVPGTDVAYELRASAAMSGTDITYAAIYCEIKDMQPAVQYAFRPEDTVACL